MNRRRELQALFERTHEDDTVILRRMANAARRRSRRAASSAPRAWAVAAACLLGIALYWVTLPSLRPQHSLEHRLSAEPSNPPARDRESTGTTRSHEAPTPALTPDAKQPSASDVASPIPGERSRADHTSTSASRHQEPSAPEPSPASWQAVAEALRNGDREKATGLLDDLARSDDPEVRDSAELVRLRSALTEAGAPAVTKPPTAAQAQRLDELVRNGATASIRASARKLSIEARRSSAASPP